MPELLTQLNLKPGYATGDNDLVAEFYAPCLDVATRYDRAVGYFRSTLYVLVGVAFSQFVLRGGRMRLVCSPELTAEDIEAISRGYDERSVLEQRMSEDIRDLLSRPSERPVVEFLATLIAVGAIEIRLAFRTAARGIFHDKVGVFRDIQENTVSFVGSINETFSAWHPEANHESFEVFASWRDAGQEQRTSRHVRNFERLWRNEAPGVVTRDFPSSVAESLIRVANPRGVDPAAEGIRQVVGGDGPQSVRPTRGVSTRRELQDHQALVLKDWISNGHRGIIDHVTGAGKTVTALRAVEYWVREHGPAIILVPSELLFRQWKTEIEADLSALAPNLLEVGAGSSRRSWEKLTADFTRDAPGLGHRIVLATMQTAASEDFRKRVRDGAHLLIVADEVHRMGAKGLRSILELRAGATLGLSATPERFGDPEGSAAIAAFFGRILVPRFSIPDAIAAGRLVPYDYYVHKCSLSAEEQTEWDMLTTRIRRAYAQLPRDGAGRRVHTEQFLQLLIRRARILKQATSKVDTALAVITSHYRPGQRWLAYCDNQEQLSRLLASLRACGVPADEYHSAMIGSRADTFVHFSAVGGVLVAIKCLDEGVDIPAVDAAVILASSTNSREFIQRRGRVLRTAPGKHSAQIHDLLVVPARDETGQPDRSRATILRTELRRASEFASHARNRGVSLELEVLARQEQVDEFASTTDEYEEDDDA